MLEFDCSQKQLFSKKRGNKLSKTIYIDVVGTDGAINISVIVS